MQIGNTIDPCTGQPTSSRISAGDPSQYQGYYQGPTQANTNIYKVLKDAQVGLGDLATKPSILEEHCHLFTL